MLRLPCRSPVLPVQAGLQVVCQLGQELAECGHLQDILRAHQHTRHRSVLHAPGCTHYWQATQWQAGVSVLGRCVAGGSRCGVGRRSKQPNARKHTTTLPYLVLQAHIPEVVCCIEALIQLHVGSLKQLQAQPPHARRACKLLEPGVCRSCRPVRV